MKERIIIDLESKKGNIDISLSRKSLKPLKKSEELFIGTLVFALTQTVRGICQPKSAMEGATNGNSDKQSKGN